MYEILLTPNAEIDLETFAVYEQRVIVDAMEAHLAAEPFRETKRRKQLRSNPLAPWELRVGNYRVFYTVDTPWTVKVLAIGVKRHNDLYIRGMRVEL